jgi:hypothetical protein
MTHLYIMRAASRPEHLRIERLLTGDEDAGRGVGIRGEPPGKSRTHLGATGHRPSCYDTLVLQAERNAPERLPLFSRGEEG